MTSRREFFGLLAAAPLVAPAVVKAAIASPNIPFLSKGMIGCRIIEGPFYASEELIQVNARIPAMVRRWGQIDTTRDNDINYIPNRLYGAQINADGDAV